MVFASRFLRLPPRGVTATVDVVCTVVEIVWEASLVMEMLVKSTRKLTCFVVAVAVSTLTSVTVTLSVLDEV